MEKKTSLMYRFVWLHVNFEAITIELHKFIGNSTGKHKFIDLDDSEYQ